MEAIARTVNRHNFRFEALDLDAMFVECADYNIVGANVRERNLSTVPVENSGIGGPACTFDAPFDAVGRVQDLAANCCEHHRLVRFGDVAVADERVQRTVFGLAIDVVDRELKCSSYGRQGCWRVDLHHNVAHREVCNAVGTEERFCPNNNGDHTNDRCERPNRGHNNSHDVLAAELRVALDFRIA